MPSSEIVLGLVCLILLAGLLVSTWRYTTIISGLSARGNRYDERMENQRIRLLEICLEKNQVSQGEDALRMAHLHGSEHRENAANQMRRDAAGDAPATPKRVKRELERRQENQPDPHTTEKDAFA